ncbi:uncharacterized protein E6C27_scaffold638G00560 [Cucumis melo var. makuwa]|uniref:Reverse transcriptase/retrotransposon-derived protein RNase H-like domain-containing protein n=1 Tax=Cucumis melo var. makuwa TaxID=1194695 RepID=A0A5A7VEE0_CUCMM|nr:uncharacterized protein E6C27_scaffold638G00560 [Cucumis melo var. makuwa]
MVDATTGHEALFFMYGYNKIRMAFSNEEIIAFRTPKGIYYYKVIPFGLKNVGATYQRAMQKDLKVVSNRLQKYQLRINPLECTFGVTSRKFIGFIVRHRGIEINQSKIDVIQKMPRPKSLHDLRSLQGRLAFEGSSPTWPKYLLNPLVLGAPVLGKSLILYITAQERSLGALLAQEDEKGKECALYYLSRTLAFTVHLVAKADPIKISGLDNWPSNGIGDRSIINKNLRFDSVMLEHFLKTENKRADALANLATALTMPKDITMNIPLYQRWIMPSILSECQEVNVMTSHLINEEDWRQPIIEYLKHGMLSKDSHYKTEEESIKALKEAHVGCPSPRKRNFIPKNDSVRGLDTEDNQELEALDEKRLKAQQALECYQARMSKAFDKHVKPHSF